MAENPRERRLRWIAWSLRHELRPLALAAVVRGRSGSPPPIPAGQADLAVDVPLRPSDRQWLLQRGPGLDDAARIEEDAAKRGWSIQTPDDGGWQERLWNELADPPAALYIRGSLHGPHDPAVAIVGARHASENGLSLSRAIARDLAFAGVTVVSGLALGIDGAAHRGALDAGGRTVAVLAGGVDRPSPPSHERLAQAIAESGALVSEFPTGTDPRPLHFPRRNRILASLASVLLVVEGRGRSGARSTVDHALSLGRNVAAVPRDPVHEGAILPNGMLLTGAAVVTSANDILPLLGIPFRVPARPEEPEAPARTDSPGGTDEDLLQVLRQGSRPLDAIARCAQRTPAEVLASLGRLELSGRVRRLHGARYERVGRDR
jgi:DNA processing protein